MKMISIKIAAFLFFIFFSALQVVSQQVTRFPSAITAREVVVKLFRAKWNSQSKVFDLPASDRTDEAEFVVLDKSFRFRSRGKENWLLVLFENANARYCHACSVAVSQIYLKKTADGKEWELDLFHRREIVSGSWGVPGKFSLFALDNDAYGLAVEESYMGMGMFYEGLDIYYRDKKILELQMQEDNSGAVEPGDPTSYSFKSKISIDRTSGVLTYIRTGTMMPEDSPGDGKVVNAKMTSRYKFNNGKYQKL